MRPAVRYAAASLVVAGVVAAIFLTAVRDAAGRRAVLFSLALALGLQLAAFALAYLAGPRRALQARAVAATARFVVLAVYALVLLEPLGLPATPALLSFATFLFLLLLLEPRFLPV